MGTAEEIKELEAKIAAFKGKIDDCSDAIKKLKRVETGVIVDQDGDTTPLEPIQIERFQTEADELKRKIDEPVKAEAEVPTPVEDPIEIIRINPVLEP